MMLSADDKDTLRRLNQHVPQYEKYLKQKLDGFLNDLPHMNVDKIQLFQGRCQMLQELLADLEAYGPNGRSHPAKPNFSTP